MNGEVLYANARPLAGGFYAPPATAENGAEMGADEPRRRERGQRGAPQPAPPGEAAALHRAHSWPTVQSTVQITADRAWDDRRHTSTTYRTHSIRQHGPRPQTVQHQA
eukprot:970630-Prymnesium_polylepis.1